MDPDEPPLELPCRDISDMTDEQKEKYLIQYLAQRIADLMRNNPQQRREWGSVIYRDGAGNFRFTPFLPAIDHRAQINWGSLPQVNGQPNYDLIVAIIHSHPEYNLPMDPATGEETRYYDPTDDTFLLRPHSGDWASYRGIQDLMSPGATAARNALMLLVLGYTEDPVGRMSLRSYNNADKPADPNGNTPVATPEMVELDMPCNE